MQNWGGGGGWWNQWNSKLCKQCLSNCPWAISSPSFSPSLSHVACCPRRPGVPLPPPPAHFCMLRGGDSNYVRDDWATPSRCPSAFALLQKGLGSMTSWVEALLLQNMFDAWGRKSKYLPIWIQSYALTSAPVKQSVKLIVYALAYNK